MREPLTRCPICGHVRHVKRPCRTCDLIGMS